MAMGRDIAMEYECDLRKNLEEEEIAGVDLQDVEGESQNLAT